MKKTVSAALTGILLASSSYAAENLLKNSSFEIPKINGRTPLEKSGNPATASEEETSWGSLVLEQGSGDGKLVAGLTDQIAADGKQSMFIDFEKVTALGSRVILSSDLFPVKANQTYRISFLGRLDRERPLSMDERRPHLLVEVEYFSADQESQLGSTDYRVQMIPGSVVPGRGTKLLFLASKWSEYFTDVKTPTDTGFMKVSFTVQAPKEAGETDGILFIDSAAVKAVAGEPTDDADAPAAEQGAEPVQ